MKRFAAAALLALVSITTACAAKGSGAGGPVIERPVDDGGQRTHVDPSAPVFGQR